jgi:glucose-1-phosphate cytidylyltransferase
MQVVILCGGQGTRIRDVSEDIPKPMIPIGPRPILWHIMKGYAQHGFTKFILCLGYKSWVAKRYFLDYHLAGSDFTIKLGSPEQIQFHDACHTEDWSITLAETGLESMTGARIKRIEKYIEGDTFMVTYGDGIADVNISELARFHHAHGRIGTLTMVRPPGRFGELDLYGNRVLKFSEKPAVAPGWINGGFFVFNRELFSRLNNDPGLIFERQPLMNLANDGELMAFRHDGFWQPMDNSRDYKLLNELWTSGEAPWKTWDLVVEPHRIAV